jgi:hypothetical protein
MSSLVNGSLVKQKAAGSTSKGAFPSMSICSMALTKPKAKADPFILFHQLILLKSHKKPKQIPPKAKQNPQPSPKLAHTRFYDQSSSPLLCLHIHPPQTSSPGIHITHCRQAAKTLAATHPTSLAASYNSTLAHSFSCRLSSGQSRNKLD